MRKDKTTKKLSFYDVAFGTFVFGCYESITGYQYARSFLLIECLPGDALFGQ
jgi:hypothetical protein